MAILETILTIASIGVLSGLVYSLIGLGLNIIFGVMRIINFAHGDFLMLGAFGVYWLYALFGIGVLPSTVLLAPLFFLLGILVYNLLIPRLIATGKSETFSFVVFFGVSFILSSGALALWGPDFRTVPSPVAVDTLSLGPIQLPAAWVVSAAASALATFLVILLLYRTYLGKSIRALIEDPVEAQLSGIKVKLISSISFGIGIVCAGVAGGLAFFLAGAIYPGMGNQFTMIAFGVVILGGLGNPLGTIIGGLLFGLVESTSQMLVPSLGTVIASIFLVAVLLLRPSGLLPRKE